jgi:hypothetical protein
MWIFISTTQGYMVGQGGASASSGGGSSSTRGGGGGGGGKSGFGARVKVKKE